MVAGVRFELTTFGLCDLTQLSLRVGLYPQRGVTLYRFSKRVRRTTNRSTPLRIKSSQITPACRDIHNPARFSFLGGEGRYSCRTTVSNDLLTLIVPLYSMNPSLRNLFMKKLMRDRVVPTMLASVSWETFASTRSG